jgi:nitrite reductase/ring-hydroxylating ferredoxin subunit
MTTRVLTRVTKFDELEEGMPTVFKVRGRSIVLVRWKEEVHALRNVCPHQTQSFEHGFVRPLVVAGEQLGTLKLTDAGLLVCPWHAWEFGLDDGRCITSDQHRVRRYDVTVRDGDVLVDV